MKLSGLRLIIILLFFTACSRRQEIRGITLNNHHKPIQGVTIAVLYPDGRTRQVIVNDKDAMFSIEINEKLQHGMILECRSLAFERKVELDSVAVSKCIKGENLKIIMMPLIINNNKRDRTSNADGRCG